MRLVKPLVEVFTPLERKLPLLIAGLLCAVVAAFGWMAHEALERSFETAAADRLSVASQRLASMLAQSAEGLRTQGRQLANDPAVVALLDSRGDAARSAANVILARQQPGPTQTASRALWTPTCELVLATGPLASTPEMTACPVASGVARAQYFRRSAEEVQPLLVRGDSVWRAVVIPVVRGPRDTVGYLVEARNIGGGATGAVVGGLIGRDATLLIGNATGPVVWTDLARRVTGPPRTGDRGVATRYTPGGGTEQLGMSLDIASTPWMLWLQMPIATAMAGEYQMLSRMAGVAILCVVLGVLGAWLLSYHVTAPILELARAEEDFAAGDYARRVPGTRRDEIGQLMSSFNRMATQVEQATGALSTRTAELEEQFRQARNLARELEMSNAELIEAAKDTMLAKRERESAQSLLDDVLTQAPVGIAVFDTNLRFVRVNHAFAAMDGIPAEQHVGQLPRTVMPTMASVLEPHLQRVLATGEVTTNQSASGTFDGGSKRHWLGSYFPVRGPGREVSGAGAVLVDTTVHFELEAELLQAQKMEAVGRLAGGVAHDFNNLLTVISSYSEMALASLSQDDELYADMQEIRSAAERASRLTKQLLAFSRKQVMQPRVLDLNRVASEMERMLRRLIGEDVVLVLALGADLGAVRADPGQIEQVLMNLALNGRDAMPDGGRLVISTANVTLASPLTLASVTVSAGEYVTLSVSDGGTGMTDATKVHLFEPFYTTKETGRGTGLGLSTVHGIIKQSGGEIAVHSTPGRGSTFVVYLPREQLDGALLPTATS